jgi:hypothetical protein
MRGAVALTAASHPLWHNLRWGQLSVPITALTLGALIGSSGRRRAGPLLLALATSIKVRPVQRDTT